MSRALRTIAVGALTAVTQRREDTVVDSDLGPAVGGGVMVVLLYMGIAMMPQQMRMNLLLMLGGMMGLTGGAGGAEGVLLRRPRDTSYTGLAPS